MVISAPQNLISADVLEISSIANLLLSQNPADVTKALHAMWVRTLSPKDRGAFLKILEIGQEPSEAIRHQGYEQILEEIPTIEDRTAVTEIMHKWADIVRKAHELAHSNGVNRRLDSEADSNRRPPGQTVRGALQRAMDLSQNTHGTANSQLTELQHNVFNHAWWVQSTSHPTDTVSVDYQQGFRQLGLDLGNFVMNPNAANFAQVQNALQGIRNASVIRPDKRTAFEEIAGSFPYVANGMWGSAHAAYKLREAIRNTMSGQPGAYRTQSLDDYMLAMMGGWELADADGNPARRAENMKEGIEGDFERIRQWLIIQLTELKDQTTLKGQLNHIIIRLSQPATMENALSYHNDPNGIGLYDVLKQASENQTNYNEVYVTLQKLSAIVKKAGWFWRRGDIRQSSEIHAGICDLLEDNMNWDQLKEKVAGLRDNAQDNKERKKFDVYVETLARLDIYQQYPNAIRQYIISNYGGAQDAKNLWRLIKLSGINSGLQLEFLHETAHDLIYAPQYLEGFCTDPASTDYLEQNNHSFTLKIALSDTQRESGFATYFLQMHTPVDCLLKLMEINRLRKAKGLTIIKMDLQLGGSDDLARGGNDNANYMQEFVRNMKGAACHYGFSQDEIREALGPNFNATNQGRQRVGTLGDQYSAERTMERHAAMIIGGAAFLHHNHNTKELTSFETEYLANCRAKDLVVGLMVPYYKSYRGEMRNQIGDATTSINVVSRQNDGSRPDTRPGKKQDWSETRAITGDFADQLGGLRMTSWLGLHQLYDVPFELLQELHQTSPQFRDWHFRTGMVLSNVSPVQVWRNSGHPELQPDNFKQMRQYYLAIETQLQARAQQGGLETQKMTEAQYETIITTAIQTSGVGEDTPENRVMLLLSHAEYAYRRGCGVWSRILTGFDQCTLSDPGQIMASFPNRNGEGEVYYDNAPNRILSEITDLVRIRAWFSAVLCAPEMMENRVVYHQRPDELTPTDLCEKTAASGLLECNRTPTAYLDSSAPADVMHLAVAKPEMAALWRRRNQARAVLDIIPLMAARY